MCERHTPKMSAVVRPREPGVSVGLMVVVLKERRILSLTASTSLAICAITLEKGSV